MVSREPKYIVVHSKSTRGLRKPGEVFEAKTRDERSVYGVFIFNDINTDYLGVQPPLPPAPGMYYVYIYNTLESHLDPAQFISKLERLAPAARNIVNGGGWGLGYFRPCGTVDVTKILRVPDTFRLIGIGRQKTVCCDVRGDILDILPDRLGMPTLAAGSLYLIDNAVGTFLQQEAK